MADELSLLVQGDFEKGSWKETFQPGSLSITVSGSGGVGNVQQIGTSAESVSMADISGGSGYMFVQNLDATNFVEYGPTVATTHMIMGKLKAGEFSVIRLTTKTLDLQFVADTAACYVKFLILPD